MKNKMTHGMGECCEKHRKYGGLKMVILGLLILGNIQYAWLSWPAFIGSLIVLAGAGALLMPRTCCK